MKLLPCNLTITIASAEIERFGQGRHLNQHCYAAFAAKMKAEALGYSSVPL